MITATFVSQSTGVDIRTLFLYANLLGKVCRLCGGLVRLSHKSRTAITNSQPYLAISQKG